MNTSLRSIVFAALVGALDVHDVWIRAIRTLPVRGEGSCGRPRGGPSDFTWPPTARASTRPRRRQSHRRRTFVARRRANAGALVDLPPPVRADCRHPHLFVSIRSEPSRRTRALALTEIQAAPAQQVDAVVYIGTVGAADGAHRAPDRAHHRAARWRQSPRQGTPPRRSGVRQARDTDAYETTRADRDRLRVGPQLNEQVP